MRHLRHLYFSGWEKSFPMLFHLRLASLIRINLCMAYVYLRFMYIWGSYSLGAWFILIFSWVLKWYGRNCHGIWQKLNYFETRGRERKTANKFDTSPPEPTTSSLLPQLFLLALATMVQRHQILPEAYKQGSQQGLSFVQATGCKKGHLSNTSSNSRTTNTPSIQSQVNSSRNAFQRPKEVVQHLNVPEPAGPSQLLSLWLVFPLSSYPTFFPCLPYCPFLIF